MNDWLQSLSLSLSPYAHSQILPTANNKMVIDLSEGYLLAATGLPSVIKSLALQLCPAVGPSLSTTISLYTYWVQTLNRFCLPPRDLTRTKTWRSRPPSPRCQPHLLTAWAHWAPRPQITSTLHQQRSHIILPHIVVVVVVRVSPRLSLSSPLLAPVLPILRVQWKETEWRNCLTKAAWQVLAALLFQLVKSTLAVLLFVVSTIMPRQLQIGWMALHLLPSTGLELMLPIPVLLIISTTTPVVSLPRRVVWVRMPQRPLFTSIVVGHAHIPGHTYQSLQAGEALFPSREVSFSNPVFWGVIAIPSSPSYQKSHNTWTLKSEPWVTVACMIEQ